MKIKKVTIKDIDEIYKIGKQEFAGEYWFTKKFLKGTFKRKLIALGAFKHKKLIGVILVELPDKPKVWIYYFVIDKKNQRKGIGRNLLKEVEKNLPKGYFLIFVDFENKDRNAKKFYKKNKFKKVAKIHDWFGDNTKGLIYCKRID